MAQAFLAADIPFYKLQNAELRNFLEKYTTHKIPSESTLRSFIQPKYERTIDCIRKAIGSSNIWVGVDETIDAAGRYIGHLMVGALNGEETTGFLLACKVLKAANHATIANLIDDSLRILWPLAPRKESVLLLLSDSVPYMKKSGKLLGTFYENMIHVTCLAHALNLVAEVVRQNFDQVNKLISNVKKIFLKAPNRVLIFKDMFPALPLPPNPILTRWGTWLQAAKYYNQNFDSIKQVVETLESTDANSISTVKSLFESDSLRSDLAYLECNFTFLSDSIIKLQDQHLTLAQSIEIVDLTEQRLKSVAGPIGEKVLSKLQAVLDKNGGYAEIKKISRIINEGSTEAISSLNPSQLCSMKYAPIVTCDIERSFSRFKSIFRDNRQSFTPENLEMTVVCNCNPF